ncbi:MAG TPA: putative motility protein [Piscirickettsiaceae bacterium]|nr:putative motility protein [Piscirickettsiaceae bacterium]HIQ40353.1 putative motility protein [Sulfurivirga caldicuralii]
MDISANGAVNVALLQQQASMQQTAQITMLKKAMDMQSQGALMLIATLPSNNTSAQALPSNVGQNINTTA